MRKIFSFLTAILFAGSMMAEVGEVFYTLVPQKPSKGAVSDYTKTGEQTIDDMTWTIPGNWYGNGVLRLGGKSIDAVDRTITGQTAMGDAISQIVITHAGVTSDNLTLNSVKVTVASDAAFSADVETVTLASGTDFTIAKNTEGTITLTPANDFWAKDSYYKFDFNITNANSSNYAWVLNKIEFYSYAAGGETPSTIKTLYCKVAQDWWKTDGAAVGVYAYADGGVQNAAWPGVRMTAVEGETDLWKADIDTAVYTAVIFTRVNASGDIVDWGAKTADLTVPADKDLYTITSTSAVWGNPGVAGEWSVYGEGGDTPEPPTPVEAAYYLVGTMNSWQAAEAYKFAPAEAEGEYLLHTTLAENDEIKVIKVEGETTTWYPAEGGNYIVDALHAGEKDIYFRPAGNEAWAEFGGYIWMGENQPAPVADFTNPFTLKFNGTGESGKDNSAAFAADVAAIFDAASAPYVASVETATKIYAGRPIADDNSSVKFGTTSAQGAFAFTLAQTIEVDSIIVNATQYGNNAAKVTVNGTEFDLTAGNKVPQDCKITPESAVSVITIAQSGTERIYLRNVRVYPKNQGGDTPEEIVLPVVKLAGSLTSWEEPVLMANAEDSLSASVTLNLGIDHYQLKVVSDDNWLSKAGDGDLYTMHRDWNHVDHLDLINTGDNIKLITDVEGAYTFTWTYADSSLVVTFPEAPAKPNYYLIGDSAFVVDAGATADKAWTPDAIPSFKDTTVLNLKAGVDYIMRLSLEGTWENHRDFRHLTDTAAGLIELPDEYQNRSIGFRLNEAGPVTIIYIPAAEEQPEVFKLIGDFYVAPVEPTAKFYITGSANLVGEENEWQPNALPVMEDSKVLALEAGDYMLKLTMNGTWEGENNVKGYDALTGEIPAGVTRGTGSNDDNICFTLAEAGNVTVTYTAEAFTIEGNFYVDPTPVVPTAAVTGDMTEWGEPIPFELSEDKTFATLYNDNIKKGTYAFKMIINGDWRSNGYEFHRGFPGCAGITGNTDANMTVVIDVEGAYTFKWYFANDSLAIIYPEKPEPVLTNGYYLVGKFGGVDAWSVEDLSAEKLFAANPDTEGEYQLSIDLAVDDEIKVVYVAEDAITTWYPKEGNYIVDDHHNGPTTMYFRPEYNSEWSAFGGYFYIVPTSTVGFENTAVDAKAVKVLKNGILVIEKNNKTYNVMGQMVK